MLQNSRGGGLTTLGAVGILREYWNAREGQYEKRKTLSVFSSFRQLYLYEEPILENISKELLLDVGFEPEKIEEEVVYDFLLKSLTSRHNVNFRLLSQKFTEKDVYGVLVKNTRDVSLIYKIGNLFFFKNWKAR